MSEESVWGKFIKNLPELDNLAGQPSLEKIETPKSDNNSSVIVYKLTTEVYVYQHIGTDVWYGANTLQDVTILGEMTLEQARSIVTARKIKRKRQ